MWRSGNEGVGGVGLRVGGNRTETGSGCPGTFRAGNVVSSRESEEESWNGKWRGRETNEQREICRD